MTESVVAVENVTGKETKIIIDQEVDRQETEREAVVGTGEGTGQGQMIGTEDTEKDPGVEVRRDTVNITVMKTTGKTDTEEGEINESMNLMMKRFLWNLLLAGYSREG